MDTTYEFIPSPSGLWLVEGVLGHIAAVYSRGGAVRWYVDRFTAMAEDAEVIKDLRAAAA